MIIGKNPENEKPIRLDIEIYCNNCGKKVLGGIKTGEKHSKTKEFKKELEKLREEYLCGICRDKNRINKEKRVGND